MRVMEKPIDWSAVTCGALAWGLADLVPDIWPTQIRVSREDCLRIAKEALKEASEFVGPLRKVDFLSLVSDAVSRRKCLFGAATLQAPHDAPHKREPSTLARG